MNKTAFFFALALIFALAVPLCIARAPQEPGEDGLIDAPYTTVPSEKLTTRATPGVQALECLEMYRVIYLTGAETDALARVIWLGAQGKPCYQEGS